MAGGPRERAQIKELGIRREGDRQSQVSLPVAMQQGTDSGPYCRVSSCYACVLITSSDRHAPNCA